MNTNKPNARADDGVIKASRAPGDGEEAGLLPDEHPLSIC
jgi:hypothetical protein